MSNDQLLKDALSHHSAGNFQEAEKIYQEILANDPEHGDACNLFGVLSHQLGNSQRAEDLIATAIKYYPDRFSYHINLGVVFEEQGKLQDAEQEYLKAANLSPKNPDILYNLGNIQARLSAHIRAISSFQEVVQLNPHHADAYFNLGNSFLTLRKEIEAKEAYKKALAIDGNFVNAWINLGEIYEKTNELDKAQECIDQLLRFGQQLPAANAQAAKLLRRTGKIDQALELLQKTPVPENDHETAIRIYFELGKLLDRVGDSDKAFENFSKGNALMTQSPEWQTVDKDRYLNRIKNISRRISVNSRNEFLGQPLSSEDDQPIFVVGFPRSGTTLIGQIMDSHPSLQLIEEQPLLDPILEDLQKNGSYQEALKELTHEEISTLREKYLANIKNFITRKAGCRIVDKFPLNIVYVDLITKIFPEAKIILVIRHPYDACLSNFMQFFELNDAMANFCTLEDAATLYNEVMSLWQKSVDIIKPDYHTVKYEELVEDMEGQTRKLLDFLKIDWNDEVLNYNKHAKDRQLINTPSYHQVVEPIYQRAKFRWKTYEKFFKKAESSLKHHVDYLGYKE